MLRLSQSVALVIPLWLGACVAGPPAGPSVMALPAQGKDFSQFQQEDGACRQYALQQAGFASPQEAATQSGALSATVGTVLGGAAGAAIGAAVGDPAAGAAIGAASGLALGGATGLSAASYSGAEVQRRYDVGYTQCMYASGNNVPALTAAGSAYPTSAYYPYALAYPYYAYPYPYYPYPVYYGYPGFYGGGFFTAAIFGGGHHHHHHH